MLRQCLCRATAVLSRGRPQRYASARAYNPGMTRVSRSSRATDRFALAVREAAPHALEVADRWHLLQNLSAAVEKTCHQHRDCLRKHAEEETAVTEVPEPTPMLLPAAELPRTQIIERTRHRYATSTACWRSAGRSAPSPAASASTARPCAVSATPPSTSCWSLPASAAPTESWNRSRHTSTPASPKRKASSWRSRLAAPWQPPGRPQTPRRPPHGHRRTRPGRHSGPPQDHLVDHAAQETLTESQDERLHQVRLACPDITRACDLARAFADMVRHQRGYLLLEWIRQAEQDAPKPMKSFAGFLRQDLDAVTAGLTLPWSSEVIEGHVNRVKTLNRAMYGRASFELLRTRILTQP